ncbi:uncharacterized protein LOC114362447 [Ostrinia furnacalis]|uniref:uncharacterized protein LOC114362447 n=1 Tax=Ostrinia furnacalis TaxID=93504 RepID=UPI00103921D7|nr:uncharacterized protein LOC114362447 [Ostrinia furnacalis]
MEYVILALFLTHIHARMFCEKTKLPLEVGVWRHDLQHMDSAVVENKPVSITEGQVYVYDNYFPGYTIKYIHVDNVAIKSCGASATIKMGGIGTSTVLIVLHADTNQEIRSVIDVWGTKDEAPVPKKKALPFSKDIKNLKSLYLFGKLRAVHHNRGY